MDYASIILRVIGNEQNQELFKNKWYIVILVPKV